MKRHLLAALAFLGAVLAACATPGPSAHHVERFGGKLYVVLLDDRDHPSIRAGRSTWGLERPLSYRTSVGGESTITVPAGFVSDLASIPALASPFLPPDGPWTKIAIVHDFLFYTRGTCEWKGHASSCTRATPFTRAEADQVLREGMADRQVSAWRATSIYYGVRAGAVLVPDAWGH